jgi:hypothetical protein
MRRLSVAFATLLSTLFVLVSFAAGPVQVAGAETLKPIGGVDIDSTIGKVDWERAATAGAKIGRRSEQMEWWEPSLKQTTEWAYELGMKVDWLSWLLRPTEKGSYTKKTLLEQYEELGAHEKSTLALIELGNEWWPGGIGEEVIKEGLTAKALGEGFIATAKVFREHEIPVPLGLQVQTSPDKEAQEWMKELGTVNHTELTEALEPRTWLPNGNYLVSHPYDGKMTVPQRYPNLLYANEGTQKLIGSTASQTSNLTIEKEHAVAYQFTAATAGTVETVDFRTGSSGSTATGIEAAVVKDNAGKPGEAVDTSTVGCSCSAAETVHEVTSLYAPVSEGTKYWLLLRPLGGNLKIKQAASGGSQSRTSNGAVTGEVSEFKWNGEETHGPAYIEGIGPGLGAQYTYEDTSGQDWGSQRWMKQQAIVKEWTGLTVPMAITEYGVAAAPGYPNSVGSWTAVGEYMEAYWSFLKKVHKGEVTSAPSGLTPVCAIAIWYDEYAWHPTEAESFGILESEAGPGEAKEIGHPNEVGEVYKRFKLGVEGL